ncbi:hypothetical protein FRZ06_02125 [Anoxybacterium hadale]|uniref:Uncharacterized protein n=1 Tax=Anoxybacterium hadale TaxID=3408580 RepID=A0ACD1A754_9FIRM|nr:hypothetical protein FRZ06_02125 [Clostridiales bacterium]
MSMNYKALTELPNDELIRQYDKIAESTCVGSNYYTEEIARRRNEKSNKLMIRLTIWITIMTAIMLLSTIVNIVIAIVK